MEKGKAKYAFHFPTPPTATRSLTSSLRQTNNPTGTKDRALHLPSDDHKNHVDQKALDSESYWALISAEDQEEEVDCVVVGNEDYVVVGNEDYVVGNEDTVVVGDEDISVEGDEESQTEREQCEE
jgi:hypothetical protein